MPKLTNQERKRRDIYRDFVKMASPPVSKQLKVIYEKLEQDYYLDTGTLEKIVRQMAKEAGKIKKIE